MLYLKLFHGRKTLEEELDDWGVDGPVFAVASFVHTTYNAEIHLGAEDGDTLGDLTIVGDCVYYDDVYYGDWSVFGKQDLSPQLKSMVQHYSAKKARVPKCKRKKS